MYFVQVNSFHDWRRLARELLKRNISPDEISWQADKQTNLFNEKNTESFLALTPRIKPNIPREFIDIAEAVACFRDESRWSLLYSVAWRLIFENHELLAFKADPQISRLFAMHKAVRRDKHKMEAFLRFRLCTPPENQQQTYVAWFQPQHLILPLTTPFFIKRFHNMCWSILTPDACAHWNGEQLELSAGVVKPRDSEDSLEDLWRHYYANIFNPARLKLKAMQSEMPKKYWINLPEARLIAELANSAGKRTIAMINADVDKPG